MKDSSKVSIIIPAYNEARTISEVIAGASVYGRPIVVDDGSTDDTAQMALSSGALVVSHKINLGYDAAISTGLAMAVAEQFDFAITIDGDGQHEPVHIHSFLYELFDGADLVVGIRDSFQRTSERLFAWLASRLWGIRDPLCGMKGYRLSKFSSIVTFTSYTSIGTELAIRAACSGWNIRQVRVSTRIRIDDSRFGANYRADMLIIRAMLLSLFKAKSYDSLI